MSDSEITNRTQATKLRSDDRLPIEAVSEIDATEDMIGMPLKEGHNHVSRNRFGFEFMVKAKASAPLKYVILDAQGNPVDEVVQIRTINKSARKTTCWECGKDKDGNTHCWKVPCPDIVGPWEPGKVIVSGYVLV